MTLSHDARSGNGVGAALALTLGLASLAPAAPLRWVSGGPFGGMVTSVVVDPLHPDTIFAGTESGVCKSTDSGHTWSSAGGGPTGYGALTNVRGVAIAPTNTSVVYAVTNEQSAGGFYRSTDGGGTWAASNTGMGSQPALSAVVVDPGDSSVLYVGQYSGQVFKSTDGGSNWTFAGAGLPTGSNGRVTALAVDSLSPATLYVATNASGVFKSSSAGASWAPANTGLSNLAVTSLAVDPVTPGTLYLGARAGASGVVVFKSTDSAAHWTAAAAGLPEYDVNALAFDRTTAGTLYAGMFGGVFKTTDSGGTWASANQGIGSEIVLAVAVSPTNPPTVLAGTDSGGQSGGVFRSSDGGASWSHPGVPNLRIEALAIDPTTPTTVYAGALAWYHPNFTTLYGGVFKSTDAGASWMLGRQGMGNGRSVHSLAVDARHPAALHAGTDWGAFKSTDGGVTWDQGELASGWIRAMLVDATDSLTVYAGSSTHGVLKSTDGGQTWLSTALVAEDVLALAADPANPSTLYAGTATGGAFKTTDAGSTWQSATTGLPGEVWALAVDPATPATIYAGTVNFGAFKSTDGAATWQPLDLGLPGNVNVLALAVDPTAPSTVYAGTQGPGIAGKVRRSTDGGSTWASVGSGLPDREVHALAAGPMSARSVYAGIRGGSVWQLPAPPTKGDLNGDGQPDLVFRSVADGAHNKVWFMDGVTRTAESDIVPDAAGPEWRVRGTDDFDADGRSDLVFWNETSGQVEFWLMNHAQRIGAAVPLTGAPALATNWDLAATADFDHDDQPDVVWRNLTSQKIVIWTMNGTVKTGNIIPSPNQAVDANWKIAAAADYNGDGNRDFLWYNATSGKIVTWYLDASVVRINGQFTSPDAAGNANWRVVASADYSRTYVPGTPPTGSPDVVWRNETSGNQVVWHLDLASTRVHGQFTAPTANTPAHDWVIVGPR